MAIVFFLSEQKCGRRHYFIMILEIRGSCVTAFVVDGKVLDENISRN